MQLPPTSSSAFDRLKATFALGISSNASTICGMIISWIVLTKTGWIEGFWTRSLYSLSSMPIFMGDALNGFILGRVRLDIAKGWDDVKITLEGRSVIDRFYFIFRGISFITTILLLSVFLASLSPEAAKCNDLRIIFMIAFGLHFIRCFHTLQRYFSPIVPSLGGYGLIKRILIVLAISGTWFYWLYNRPDVPFSITGFITHGIIFLLLCSIMQPLPSRYSIFRPGKVSGEKLMLQVEKLSEEEKGRLNPAIAREADQWSDQFGFIRMDYLKMPLIELPLFRTAGSLLRTESGDTLLLILQSEIRQRVHKTLLSKTSRKLIVTTDFGAPEAKFPDDFIYSNRSFEESKDAFLGAHIAACSEMREKISATYAVILQDAVNAMIKFLETEIRYGKQQGSQKNADAEEETKEQAPPPGRAEAPLNDENPPDDPSKIAPKDSE